jgi:3-hydroxyisobutyrate dehydrogenase/2-hydroxy-3-oxopropionate reductase
MVRPEATGNEQETGLRNYFMMLMIKDLEVAIEEAAKFGARLPMVELIRDNALSTSGLEHPLGQPL